jgi:hypothetical protein
MRTDVHRLRHPSTNPAPDDRDRGRGYVESPAALERAFQEALDRNRKRLTEQRESLRRFASDKQMLWCDRSDTF